MTPDATFNMPTEPTRLQLAEDWYQQAEHVLGLELTRYRVHGDRSPEQAQRVELARQEWRKACDALVKARAEAERDELPY